MTRLAPLTLALPLCLAASPLAADPLDDQAIAAFKAGFAEACTAAFQEDGSLIEAPQRHEAMAAASYGEAQPVTLWQFTCNMGAYNLQSVVLIRTEFYGITPLAFARPDLTLVYEVPDDPESRVTEVKVAGWSASPFLTNGGFDPATGEFSEDSKWRGLGDASSSARWKLIDEGARLVQFDVDASYDGEINPETLVRFE